MPCGGFAADRTFCVSGKSAAFAVFDSAKGLLKHIYIRGFQLDVVKCIGSELELGFDPDMGFDLKAVSTFLSEVRNSTISHQIPTGMSLEKTLYGKMQFGEFQL